MLPARPAGPLALVAAGILFVVYPVLRPYGDAAPAGMAAAFAEPAWIVAHLAAVAAFVLAGAGLVTLSRTAGTRTAQVAVGTWVAGAALVLPYYGAEVYALHALGVAGVPDLPALAEDIRMGAVAATAFGTGLGLLAVSAVLAAVAAARAGLGAAGATFAAGMVLFLPQFFAVPGLRIAHGVLLGAGCLVLGLALARRPVLRTAAPAPLAR